jgi:hypothetical protein
LTPQETEAAIRKQLGLTSDVPQVEERLRKVFQNPFLKNDHTATTIDPHLTPLHLAVIQGEEAMAREAVRIFSLDCKDGEGKLTMSRDI